MQELFGKVIAHVKAQNGFRDYADAVSAGDIRRPRYEGDFATSTDASKLFEEGVNVPQEAINLSRISSTKALDKVMPDWAVQEWLAHFLARDDLPLLADAVQDMFGGTLDLIPVPGRRKKFFDYRVSGKTPNRIFSDNEVWQARQQLRTRPHIVAGVLLWQFALKVYAHELAEHTLRSTTEEPLKTRLAAYCRFLSASAFMLGSFAALLPIAITQHEEDAAKALEEFSARGGFMKRERPQLFFYLLKLFKKRPRIFPAVSPLKPRVIICSAKEALPRWAALPVNNQGSLAACIAAVEKLAAHEGWKKLGLAVQEAITKGNASCRKCPINFR